MTVPFVSLCNVFQTLRHLPDPMLGSDDHYLSFEEVSNMKISEKDRPSLSHVKKANSSLHPYQQACTKCECHRSMWRVWPVEVTVFWTKAHATREAATPSYFRRCLTFVWSYFSRTGSSGVSHVFMSSSITATIPLSHSIMQQGLIPSVSTVLVRCRTWVRPKIIQCVTAAKTKSPLREDRLFILSYCGLILTVSLHYCTLTSGM